MIECDNCGHPLCHPVITKPMSDYDRLKIVDSLRDRCGYRIETIVIGHTAGGEEDDG